MEPQLKGDGLMGEYVRVCLCESVCNIGIYMRLYMWLMHGRIFHFYIDLL